MTSIIPIYMIIIYQLIYAKPSTTAVTAGWGRYDTTNTYYRIIRAIIRIIARILRIES